MDIWFDIKYNGIKTYNSKSISINFYPKHWRICSIRNNGAVKGKDKCYDMNIWCLGFNFSYTNWDYNA